MRSKTLIALTAVAALSLPAAALAKNGADDPAGHVRHASHSTTHHVRHHARHARHTGVHHARHGADDGPNHR
jgi:hypothetical protein